MNLEQMNPELQAKLDSAESLDDVVRLCEEAGIAVSKEQLEAMDVPMADGELSEETLDAVSGGSVAGWILWYWWRNRGRNRSSGGGGSGSFGGGGSGRSGGR